MDTTEYLMSSQANKKHLLASIQEANEGKFTKIDVGEFFKKKKK